MSIEFPELYVLRHGQTVWNLEGRIQGAMDSPLTDLGRAQAKRQNEILAAEPLDGFKCWTSPQGRALDTARIAVSGLVSPIQIDARLAEIGVGEWEGKTRDAELMQAPLDDSGESDFDLYERAPGGEGFAALRARCQLLLNDLDGPAVLVTHGMTSRMLRLILQNMDTSELGRVEGGQGVVFHIKDGACRKLV